MTREEMKAEALARMISIHLSPKTVEEFSTDGTLTLSKGPESFYIPIHGDIRRCNLSDEEKEWVRDFEAKTGCLVYHVIRNFTSLGDMVTLLYVSNYPEEWEQDRADLKKGFPLAYVINLDHEDFSEFGTVEIRVYDGAVLRIQ